jgi:NAD(P)-dependent dehydrogenase (short-subunit alcohol dehydrogenase family)
MLRLPNSAQAPLAGQVALVTGASSGIGAAAARELGRRGASLVLAARRVPELEAEAATIRTAGGEAVAVPTDVGDPDQIRELAWRTMQAFGRVDVLVNNAGASWFRTLATSSPDELTSLLEVNLMGPILLTRAVLPGMLGRGRGSVICVGSLSGRVAMEPLYSASKYGLRGFTLALRRQLAGSGVSVSLVSPGNIDTAMTSHKRGRLPKPELVATTIADLVTEPRREVVIPRKHYAIAWLEQLLPAMADVAYRRRHWSPVEEGAAWTS